MPAMRTERPVASKHVDLTTASLWAGLSRRQVAELLVPGATIGLFAGVIAGGLGVMGGLSLAVSLVAAVSLALPLALGGAVYDLLLTMGRIPLGPLAPMALFWAVAFPIARILNAALVNLVAGDPVAVPHGWLDFIVYNMLLSVGFAIGFWWMHQNYAPRWWFHLRGRNPVAAYFINSQLQFLGWQGEQRDAKRQERKDKRAAKAGRSGVSSDSARSSRRGKGDDAPLS
jgi:hypothetical protein